MAGIYSARINPVSSQLCYLKVSPLFSNIRESSFQFAIKVRRSYRPWNIVATALQPQNSVHASHFGNKKPSKEVLDIWRNADVVCFDVDSTVCLDEGIDEFAEFCGAGKAVAEWTNKAMSGSIPFEEALGARLSIFKPSLSQLNDFLGKRPPRISPGIAQLIGKLKACNADIYLISGGFRQMIKLDQDGGDFLE
ncbi:hypothetical protein HPP92_011840 [Vanilla planifolia]|uniref:phosphoserine phosphatase n=1 Tax=Vanilla planifolia TaxID=51239 RepID=A0A835R1E1_VANPL|nr:hypothetical protein HPP92_012184 [Vanilla planifolia]KAG0483756.1 hypothetical protein HPP92_011840 [Vanilla planifolia]